MELHSVLAPDIRDNINKEHMLADDDVVYYRQTHEPITLYTDIVLKGNRSKRLEFYEMMCSRGLIGISKQSSSHISLFFVSKKAGKQRLVLDCRRTNQLFRKPHRPDLGPAESIQRLECPSGLDGPVFEAEAD